MGFTQSSYARFERGATKTDLKTISLFAQAMEMNIIDIFTYPEKYINSKEVNIQTTFPEPEVVLQIKITGDKRVEMLKTFLGSCGLDII
jgi:transcriptional regulator with XRE-family HTH domain